jgi:hypothetical protein
MSGAMLFRPSYEIAGVKKSGNELLLTLKDFTNDSNFEKGSWVKRGKDLGSNETKIYRITRRSANAEGKVTGIYV